MKIYFIRHGESLDDTENRFGGFADYELNEEGKGTIDDLSKILKDKRIEKLYTSPYVRAYETASGLSKSLNIPLEISIDIRERNTYGFLSGMRKELAEKLFPEDYAKTKSQETADEIDGAEKMDAVEIRVRRFLERALSSDEEVIGVLTHGKALEIIFKRILKLDKILKPKEGGYVLVESMNGTYSILDSHNVE